MERKKVEEWFPHLGIELNTSRTEILAPLKTEQIKHGHAEVNLFS